MLAREDRPGDKRLVAYVVGTHGASRDAGGCASTCAAKLPEYMVPVGVRAAGRAAADRERQGGPPGAAGAGAGGLPARRVRAAPRTELERRLCEIWEELLGVERVGIEDNFFDLGGHSLLATRVVSRVRSALGRELPLRTLFEHPTIGELCERLPELSGGWGLPPIEVRGATGRSCRCPTRSSASGSSIVWKEGAASTTSRARCALRGALDKAAFAAALRTIVERHESLRTVFRRSGRRGGPGHPGERRFPLPETDLSGLEAAAEGAGGRGAWRWRMRGRPFDLSRDLLLRAGLLRLSERSMWCCSTCTTSPRTAGRWAC